MDWMEMLGGALKDKKKEMPTQKQEPMSDNMAMLANLGAGLQGKEQSFKGSDPMASEPMSTEQSSSFPDLGAYLEEQKLKRGF